MRQRTYGTYSRGGPIGVSMPISLIPSLSCSPPPCHDLPLFRECPISRMSSRPLSFAASLYLGSSRSVINLAGRSHCGRSILVGPIGSVISLDYSRSLFGGGSANYGAAWGRRCFFGLHSLRFLPSCAFRLVDAVICPRRTFIGANAVLVPSGVNLDAAHGRSHPYSATLLWIRLV